MPRRGENNEKPSNLRRSPRFHHPNTPLKHCHSKSNPDIKSKNSRVSTEFDSPIGSTTTVPRKSYKSGDGLRRCSNSRTELRRSPRLNHGSSGLQCTRRPLRLENLGRIGEKCVEKTRDENDLPMKRVPIPSEPVDSARALRDSVRSEDDESGKCADSRIGLRKSRRLSTPATRIQSIRRSPRFLDRDVLLDAEKPEVDVGLYKKSVLKKDRSFSNTNRDSGRTEVLVEDSDIGNEGIGIKSKRNDGWTKEQEMALQDAYFTEKPTPHFWKKVSKKVAGKSAQDCFDKIHSNHLTPPQPKQRSRAKKTGPCVLSASKLLKPTELKKRRARESHLGHKTVRFLLQKHGQVYQDHDRDLFSDLEPATLSTPQHALGKIGFNKNSHESCSSGRKNKVSSCKCSIDIPLVSPPVLKQVKNKAVHERFITQLHRREAKRMAASSWVAKSHIGKENMERTCLQNVDVVRAARSALVSDAQDAIEQFRHKQANATCHFFEFDGANDSNIDYVEDEEH